LANNDKIASTIPSALLVTFPQNSLHLNFSIKIKGLLAGQTTINGTTEEEVRYSSLMMIFADKNIWL